MSIVDELYALQDGQAKCLFQGHDVEVWQYRQWRWLLQGGELIQSVMSTEQPAVPVSPVSQAMLAALSLLEHHDHLLNLGFGGGSIERYLLKHQLPRTLHSVDSDEMVIHLAQQFFAIDPGYTVYLDEAGHFVAGVKCTYNALLCDIFDGQAHPDCLYDPEFYAACRQRLQPDGLLIANLVPEDQADLVQLLLPLRKNFAHTGLIELPQHDNLILLASNEPLERPQTSKWSQRLEQVAEIKVSDVLGALNILPAIETPAS